MFGECYPATLDGYERGIRNLCSIHGPSAWGIIVCADEVMRGEQWHIMREENYSNAVIQSNKRYQTHLGTSS